jgi:hypothetical protein
VIGKGMSYQDDVLSGLSGMYEMAKSGVSELNLQLFQRTLKRQIDRMYGTGKSGKNDVATMFSINREYFPIEMGGFPKLTSFGFLAGPSHTHSFKIVHFGTETEKRALASIATYDKDSAYNVFLENDVQSNISLLSKTSIFFNIRIHSKVEALCKQLESLSQSDMQKPLLNCDCKCELPI